MASSLPAKLPVGLTPPLHLEPCPPHLLSYSHAFPLWATRPDPVLCHSQVRAASAVGPSRKGAVPAPPGKAGSTAALTQARKQEGDSESSSEEESDSDGEAPAAQVRPLSVRLFSPPQCWEPSPSAHRDSVYPLGLLCLCAQPCIGLSHLILSVSFQAKSSGKVLQVKSASGPTIVPPQKAGPAATKVKVERSKEDPESSSEESDSEEEASSAMTPAQVRPQEGQLRNLILSCPRWSALQGAVRKDSIWVLP